MFMSQHLAYTGALPQTMWEEGPTPKVVLWSLSAALWSLRPHSHDHTQHPPKYQSRAWGGK